MNRMKEFLNSEKGNEFLEYVYGKRNTVREKAFVRYLSIYEQYQTRFNREECALVSVPGRVEISGNHTDHNHGKVIAGSISLDAVAVCSRNNDQNVVLFDLSYNELLKVDLSFLDIVEEERGNTRSLIRGVAAWLKQAGCNIGGFTGVLRSNVMPGSGLSSSAVFEVMIGSIFNILYNGSSLDPLLLAKAGQFAENEYFGKPCGMMDQCACAVGGMVFIDFKNPDEPEIKKIENYPEKYILAIVKTGGDHTALTECYTAIPGEMKCVASVFGKNVLRGLSLNDIIENSVEIRKKCGDRAFLRSLHFITENRRVEKQKEFLLQKAVGEFLQLVNESGDSSWKNLQNVTVKGQISHQRMAVTLAVAEAFIRERGRGAARVHGGGFEGTILSFIHEDDSKDYMELMEQINGKGCVSRLSLRTAGASSVWKR